MSVTSSPFLTLNSRMLKAGACEVSFTVTFLPSRKTPLSLGSFTASGNSSSVYTGFGRSSSRLKMMKSCGSPRTGWSASSTIFSPEMSMSCSFSGCSGPAGRKRSLENLQPTASHLPSAALVSDCEALR